jgi:hypothetical protein
MSSTMLFPRRRTTARLVARTVIANAPFVRCFRCLSQQAGVSEKEARDAGRRLILRDQFFIAQRECQRCGLTDDVLVNGKAA